MGYIGNEYVLEQSGWAISANTFNRWILIVDKARIKKMISTYIKNFNHNINMYLIY